MLNGCGCCWVFGGEWWVWPVLGVWYVVVVGDGNDDRNRGQTRSSAKIGTIQRRLAWPLRKDDTHKSRSYHTFLAESYASISISISITISISISYDILKAKQQVLAPQSNAIWHSNPSYMIWPPFCLSLCATLSLRCCCLSLSLSLCPCFHSISLSLLPPSHGLPTNERARRQTLH